MFGHNGTVWWDRMSCVSCQLDPTALQSGSTSDNDEDARVEPELGRVPTTFSGAEYSGRPRRSLGYSMEHLQLGWIKPLSPANLSSLAPQRPARSPAFLRPDFSAQKTKHIPPERELSQLFDLEVADINRVPQIHNDRVAGAVKSNVLRCDVVVHYAALGGGRAEEEGIHLGPCSSCM